MIRSLLLWISRNERLGRTLPRRTFVRRGVRRFMPGESRSEALAAAESLIRAGIGVVFTLLGENVASGAEVEAVVQEYLDLLSDIQDRGSGAHISVKLTQLGLDIDFDLAVRGLTRLVEAASESGSFVWIDMEDSSYRERTLRVFREGLDSAGTGGSVPLGICLQAYLKSTPEDVRAILPLAPTIRMVKGAYAETPEVAHSGRAEVDRAYFAGVTEALARGARVAVATHDTSLIRRILEWVEEKAASMERLEVQMLYGIRSEEQRRLVRDGVRVRVLISYGPAWFPWYMRRLAERPANLWFVAKNLFRK